jgi:cyclic pyranopterin phosphate synthase
MLTPPLKVIVLINILYLFCKTWANFLYYIGMTVIRQVYTEVWRIYNSTLLEMEKMRDKYNRTISYLRVSVTDRCNFRCFYCMPRQGFKWLPHSEILTYEELLRLIAVFSREGIKSVRITGGEPLVRKGIVGFIAAVKALGVIQDISLTTNGSLLPEMAYSLKKAGLDRVNISLDTTDPAAFAKITSGGNINDTLQGIKRAFEAGLTPVKLNVVLTEVLTEEDISYFVKLVRQYPIAVRFIERMPLGPHGETSRFDIDAVKNLINAAGLGTLEPTDFKGNGPAKYFRLAAARGVIGFITPLSEHFCGVCNRVRLTADGKLRPCLLNEQEINIKYLLRSGAGDEALAELFRCAVWGKPACHTVEKTEENANLKRNMSQLGG